MEERNAMSIQVQCNRCGRKTEVRQPQDIPLGWEDGNRGTVQPDGSPYLLCPQCRPIPEPKSCQIGRFELPEDPTQGQKT